MILDFKRNNNLFDIIEEDNQIDLRLSDSEHIDNNLNIESIIIIFQYLKDRYMKINSNPFIQFL
jgi:hypothetical protein